MAEACSCEDSIALRAEIAGLETVNAELRAKADGKRVSRETLGRLSAEVGRLQKERELARELMAVAERIGTDADLWIEGEALLAKARALGVEAGR